MDDTTAHARLKYLRTAPPKVRQVLGLIRGQDVERARDILEDVEREAARPVLKLLDSAVANAEANLAIPEDELVIQSAWVDEGPTLRRWRPRARGRATRIRKRTSHVTVVVGRLSEEQLERKTEREEVEGAPTRRRLRRRRVEATRGTAEEPEAEEPEAAGEELDEELEEGLDEEVRTEDEAAAGDEAGEEAGTDVGTDEEVDEEEAE